jgi:hypothetical protein
MNERETIQEILGHAKTVAVVGLSPKPGRPSSDIAQYLQEQGYRVIPVNFRNSGGKGILDGCCNS